MSYYNNHNNLKKYPTLKEIATGNKIWFDDLISEPNEQLKKINSIKNIMEEFLTSPTMYQFKLNFTKRYWYRQIAFLDWDLFKINFQSHYMNSFLNLLLKYKSMTLIDLENIVKDALQSTEVKNLHRENNSQEQRTSLTFDEGAVNYETMDKNEVIYGNKLSVLKNLIRNGIPIDFDLLMKPYDAMFISINEPKECETKFGYTDLPLNPINDCDLEMDLGETGNLIGGDDYD